MSLQIHDPFVLAICGPSGAGKSALIQQIQHQYPESTAIALDDYASVSMYPDAKEWIASGADPNRFETPEFIADLQALIYGQTVTLPDYHGVREPAPLILVEEPFGRQRQAIAPLLDAVVYVTIPADLALARKLLRRSTFFPWENDFVHHLRNVREFLSWYTQVGHQFAQVIEQQVRPHCDLVIDGTMSSEYLAGSVLNWVEHVMQERVPR